MVAKPFRPASRVRTGRAKRRARARANAEAFLFLTPNLLLFIGLVIVPIVIGFGLSLYEWDLLNPPIFIGLTHFQTLAQDSIALGALRATLVIIFGAVVPTVLISFLLANVLNSALHLRRLVRFAYLSPIFISTVAAGVLWRYIFSPQGGVSHLVRSIGLAVPDWLGDPSWATVATIIVVIWKGLPIATLFYLAALQGVPKSLHEAASLDGANDLQRMRYITWPAVSDITVLITIITLIGAAFGAFDVVAVLTQGGPLRATNILPYYAYTSAFSDFRFGYASAISSVLCLIVLAATAGIIVRQQRSAER